MSLFRSHIESRTVTLPLSRSFPFYNKILHFNGYCRDVNLFPLSTDCEDGFGVMRCSAEWLAGGV